VNEPDPTVTWYRNDGLAERLWAYDETSAEDERSAADLTGGLVNFGFFTAALRRGAWIWCLTAILGLLIGSALFVKYPPAYHATTTVLLVDNPNQTPSVEVQTDASMAQSQPVAEHVVQELRLPQSVASFQAAYTVTVVTDTVLTFNVGAPSSADAVQRASALATAYLQYRAQYAQDQEKQLFDQLDQQYNAAQQRLKSIDVQLSELPSVITSAQKAQYYDLQGQQDEQRQIEQDVNSTKSSAKTYTSAMVNGSYVLDAANALPRSKTKGVALYVGGGLFGGLAIGIGGVIVAALMSRRLRRRDDIAIAMGAPVRLSVGPLRKRRLSLTSPRRAAKQKLDMRRVTGYLRGAVPGSSRGPASLAVVAVDDAQVVAQVVVSLAASCAEEGKQVVVADLSGVGHLAHLLGVSGPGIHPVGRGGANLMLVLPRPDDIAPVGPVPWAASPAMPVRADEALVTACSSADILLTLATLDPAFGGDHLGTWATNAVAVVTAGESTAEKIHGVGEMVRLAGTRLDSVVLTGADKSDESLGVLGLPAQSALIKPV
jgi:capsular polysaccharide biosynthesis protein